MIKINMSTQKVFTTKKNYFICYCMRLKQFIKSNGFNSKTFANAIGIKCRTVEAWSRGERLPRWQDAKKIFVFTDNKVTGQDLYDEQIQKQETILQRDKVRQ